MWVSLVLYIGGLGIAHALLIPSHRKINGFLRSASPPAGDIVALEQRITAAAGVNSLIFVVILLLMVVKPL